MYNDHDSDLARFNNLTTMLAAGMPFDPAARAIAYRALAEVSVRLAKRVERAGETK